MKPKALLIDVFGTVVNRRLGITRDLTTHFQNHPCKHAPEVIADAWREQYKSSMEPIRSGRRFTAVVRLGVILCKIQPAVWAYSSVG